MKETRKILFNVIVPVGTNEQEFIDEILSIETKMNSLSKFRYHLQEPEDIKLNLFGTYREDNN